MAQVQLFSIHHDKIKSQLLKSLLQDEDSKDVAIVTDDGQVKIHRNILTNKSPLFAKLLSSSPQSRYSIIFLRHLSTLEVLTFVKFLYLGKVDPNSVPILETTMSKLKSHYKMATDSLLSQSLDVVESRNAVKQRDGCEPATRSRRRVKIECPSCDKSFTRKIHLVDHEKIIHRNSLRNYSCKLCGFVASWYSSLHKHLRKKHLHVSIAEAHRLIEEL